MNGKRFLIIVSILTIIMMLAPNFQLVGNISNNSQIQSNPSNVMNVPVRTDVSGGIISININTDAFIANGNSTISILNTLGLSPVQYLYLNDKTSITSSVAVTPNGSSILVGTSNDMGLNIINTTTAQTDKIILTPATKDESNITVSPNGHYAYVSGSNTYNISVVSLLNYSVVKVLNVSYDPGKMVISPNGTTGFSFSMEGPNGATSESITEINTVNNSVIRNVTDNLLNNPDTGAISPNGSMLLIGNTGNATITAINISNGAFKNIREVFPCVETKSITFNLQGTLFFFVGKNPTVPPFSHGGATAELYSATTFGYDWSLNLTKTNSSTANGMIYLSSSNRIFVSVANPDRIVEVGIEGTPGSPCLKNEGNLTNPLTPGQMSYFPTSFLGSFMVFENGLPSNSKWDINLGGFTFSSNKSYINVTAYYGKQSYGLTAPNFYAFHNSSGYLNVNLTSSYSFKAFYTLNYSQSRNYAILTENYTRTGSPVFSTLNNTYLASLPTGYQPFSNAITPNGTLLVTLDDYPTPSLNVINMHTFKQIANISLPAEKSPCFVSINPDGLYAYVGACSYNLSVVSLNTFSVVKVLNVSYDSTHMAFLPNGTEGFVTTGETYNCIGTPRNFTVINTENNTVIKTVYNPILNCSFDDAVSPNGTYLVIPNCNNLTIFNTKTLKIVKNLHSNEFGFDVAEFSSNGSKLYVTSNYGGTYNFSEIWMNNFTLHTMISAQSISIGQNFAFNGNESEVYLTNFGSSTEAYNMNNLSQVTSIPSGANPFSKILIPASSYYGSVTFMENGLPANTPWSVTLSGLKYGSGSSNITAYSYAGLQNYSINIPAGYSLSVRSSGQIMVSYENTTVRLTFIPTIIFEETGLGSAPVWYLNIKGYNTSGKITSGTYSMGLPLGSYEAIATSPYAQTYYLNFSFSTTGQTFTIPFKEQYNFSVSQTGLSNVVWYVNVTNKTGIVSQMSGTGSTLSANLINGSYNYTVASSNKIYKPSPYDTHFTISGSSYAVREPFTTLTYNVTFSESGLPSGTAWYVNITGQTSSGPISAGSSYFKNLTNGTYYYSIWAPDKNYYANSSNFIVNGTHKLIHVKFIESFSVIFSESGLPSSTIWYVNITGQKSSGPIASGSTFTVSLPNGSYQYNIATNNKIYHAPASSFTESAGSPSSVSVTFSLYTYTVTFTESGLPSGTAWYVNLSNGMKSGAITTSTYSFSLTNGSVSYTISGTSGYSANRTSGSFTVNGNNVAISVKFSKPSSPSSSITAIEEYSIVGAVVALALIGAFIWKRRSP